MIFKNTPELKGFKQSHDLLPFCFLMIFDIFDAVKKALVNIRSNSINLQEFLHLEHTVATLRKLINAELIYCEFAPKTQK